MQGHCRQCRRCHATSAFWKFGLEKFRLLNYGEINTALVSMNFRARLQTPVYFYAEFSQKCSSLQWISCFTYSRSYTCKDICQLAGRFCFILVVNGIWSGDVFTELWKKGRMILWTESKTPKLFSWLCAVCSLWQSLSFASCLVLIKMS